MGMIAAYQIKLEPTERLQQTSSIYIRVIRQLF